MKESGGKVLGAQLHLQHDLSSVPINLTEMPREM